MKTKSETITPNNTCAKEKLKPWLVGLLILFVVVMGWILLGKGWKNREYAREDRMFLGKTNLPGGIESRNRRDKVAFSKPQDSYRNIVELIKPAVVGISLPNARPFFQKWGMAETPPPDLTWLRCPGCGWVTIEPPENLLTPIICPNCSTVISQNPQVQKQAWWQPTRLPQGQMQAWGMRGQGFGANTLSMLCPNCKTTVTRQPGIPWTAITCPNCGLSMFCPRLPNNPLIGQKQVWMQPTVQPQPPSVQNGPFTSPGQEVVMPGFQGLGSGVVVSQRGYILTNSHLVLGQRFVTVTLFTPQGQSSFKGQVVVQAPDRDLAIVKIDSQNIDLPVAPVSNSNTVQVGDTVLAFGNPFGLSQTVTSGIISAVRTSTVIEGHQFNDLIQTDAPINQGNSGGPLVNLRGEVIGINTAIYSPAQTHTGLGFAVPINQAKEVFGSYMDGSAQKVNMQFLAYPDPKTYPTAGQKAGPRAAVPEDAPAWLGINIQILNDVLAEQLNVPVDRGILINEVYVNSPAGEAGLRRQDVIIRFDGKRITDETQIRTLLAKKKPGDKVKMTILRGRKRLDIKFETAGGGWWQAQPAAVQNKSVNLLKNAEIETGSAEIVSLGIAALTITPEIAFTYGLPKDARGIIATETEGLALNCGIRDGDIIKKVNNRATPDLVSFLKAIKRGDPSRGIALSLIRGGMPIEIVIKEKPELLPRGL